MTPQKDVESFVIDSPESGKTLWIAKTEKERDEWVESIQASINETKELVKQGVVKGKDEKPAAAKQSGYLSSWFSSSPTEVSIERKE